MNLCGVCGRNADWGGDVCAGYEPSIAPSLRRACYEEREGGYRLGLRDGTQIAFDWADITDGWVTLRSKGGFDRGSYGHPFPRGIDIRLDLIVWCARDPDGLEEAGPAA